MPEHVSVETAWEMGGGREKYSYWPGRGFYCPECKCWQEDGHAVWCEEGKRERARQGGEDA